MHPSLRRGLTPEFYVTCCTCDQLATLTQNAWKYTQVKGKHVRIRPRRPDVSIMPPGPVNYTAEIEILDAADRTWGDADSEAQKVVEALFASVL